MIRDPHYRAILDALSATGLDHDAFERCAQDLLRGIYPGLTPVAGGSDLGMDGLDTSDPDAPKILVATTGQDVRGNLVRNLQSHKRQSESIGARHVVVASTQPAVGSLHESLRKAASSEGFYLVNVHGREAFADLLYRSSRWARELLGLSGVPSALSAVPASSRLMSDLPLIGRDSDKQWLLDSCGDIVVSGHPASGKTHLLRQFVDDGWLFLVDSDRERIANAVRELKAEVIVVDDAHVDPQAIIVLKQLRSETGAKFRIAAVTWPGDMSDVTRALAVPSSSTLELKPLRRNDILEVIKAAGIKDWMGVQKEIVDQSIGLPGLAITLCDIAIGDDFTRLFSGESLLREIRATITQIAGDAGMQILAVLALAGESGASLDDVHSILELSVSESHKLLTRLGHTGVFRTDSLGEKTTIWPRELRFIVVGSYFFSEKPNENLPLVSSLDHFNERDVIGSLLGAAVLGANVPAGVIEPMLRRVGSVEDFSRYAGIDRQQAKFALTERSQWLTQIAPFSLLTIPEETLPRLLQEAGDPSDSNSLPFDPPMEIIRSWIQGSPELDNEQVKRRMLLLRVTKRYADSQGDPQVVLEGLCRAMDPKFVLFDKDVLSDFYSVHSLVSKQCLESLSAVWSEVISSLPISGPSDFTQLIKLLGDWGSCGQSRVRFGVPDEVCDWMRNQWSIMLRDVAARYSSHPGVSTRLRELSEKSNVPLDIFVSREFDVLYPTIDYSVYHEDGMVAIESQQQRCRTEARVLAKELAQREPFEVTTKLRDFRNSAAVANVTDEGMAQAFADELSKHVSDPYAWALAAIRSELDFVVVEPLLRAARTKDRNLMNSLITEALGYETAKRAAMWHVFTDSDPSHQELDSALSAISDLPDVDVRLFTGDLVRSSIAPESTLRSLLCHESSVVAGHTASHFRIGERNRGVSSGLSKDWKAAILRSDGGGDIGNIIFVSNTDIFVEWILEKNACGKVEEIEKICDNRIVVDVALERLSADQRVRVLSEIDKDCAVALSEFISVVVSDDERVFRAFLNLDNMKPVHRMLFGDPTCEKIRSACDAGWSYERIVRVILFRSGLWVTWTGEESEYWKQRYEYFAEIAKSDDVDVSSVGKVGCGLLDALRSSAKRRERDQDVYGS